jgi:membrane-associated phospholipid phosphatase
MEQPQNASRHLRILAICLIAVALVILFVDRAASSWTHAHLHRFTNTFRPLTYIVEPVRPAAIIGLVLAGLAFCCGWRPGSKGMTLIALCLSVVTAYEIKEWLKLACGRTWPETWTNNNPSWIGTGDFGFSPFHGHEGWFSFPSGHMTQMAAIAAVLWQRVRPLRWVGVALALLVAAGLYVCDYHFVGDMLAGTFLGAACASGVLALLFER